MGHEIAIKDVIAYTLKNIRTIVVAIIVFCILFLIYNIYMSFFNQGAIEKSATELEMAQIQYNLLETEVQDGYDYIKNSVLFSIDAYKKPVSVISGYFDTGYKIMPEMTYQDPNQTPVVMQAISSVASTAPEIMDAVRTAIANPALNDRYTKELFSIDTDDSGSFIISATYTDEDTAREIASSLYTTILDQLNAIFAADFDDGSPPYTVHIISNFTGRINDNALQEAKNNVLQQVNEAETKLKAAELIFEEKNNLSDFNFVDVLKYLLLAGAAGVVAGCVLVLGIFLLNGKVNTLSDVAGRHPVALLGVFPPRKRGRLHDVAISLQNVPEAETEEAAYEIIALNLGEVSGAICAVSTARGVDLRAFSEKLQTQSGKDIRSGGNILKDPAAIRACMDARHVIIVEKTAASRLQDIDMEYEKIKAWGKTPLGFVLLQE